MGMDVTDRMKLLKEAILQEVNKDSCDINCFKLNSDIPEDRTMIDQALRETLYEYIEKDDGSLQKYFNVFKLAVEAAKHGLTSLSAPFVLFEDTLDATNLSTAEEVFAFLEANVSSWRNESFYSSGKNVLLRACNNLLRRLSTLQHTEICGKVQLLLASLFPLDEKSALNIMSSFNLDNVTTYSQDETDMALSTKEQSVIDFSLYNKFWSLQDYFRSPTSSHDWLQFSKDVDAVLQVFTEYKLDSLPTNADLKKASDPTEQCQVYFAKNLTSPKLFDLQLSDSNFRRQFLVEIIVLCQYLSSGSTTNRSNKFKPPPMTDELVNWMENTVKRAYNILNDIPPNGCDFAKTVRHIINREEFWIAWKNSGCPKFVRSGTTTSFLPKRKFRTRKHCYADTIFKDDSEPSNKKLCLGNTELTRLWNINSNNMDSCQVPSCTPSIDTFFAEAADQIAPDAGVEDQYKLIKQPNFQWRALRLLSHKSSLFYQPIPSIRTVPEFLSHVIEKMIEPTINQTPKSEQSDNVTERVPTPDELTSIAKALSEVDYRSLATHFEVVESELKYYEEKFDTLQQRAIEMLLDLQARSSPDFTVSTYINALNELDLQKIANEVFSLSEQ